MLNRIHLSCIHLLMFFTILGLFASAAPAGTERSPLAASIAPPAVPNNPFPSTGAANVPLDVTLKWNQITTSLVATRQAAATGQQVLVFNGHSDNSATGEYNNTLKALREHFTGFTATATATENASALAAELDGKQVFLMTEQENWSASAMAAFGTAAGPVLRQFVQGGGLVVVCDHFPNGGASQFLAKAGLMNTTFSQATGDLTAKVVATNPITAGVSASFTAMNGAVVYDSVGDAQVLVANTSGEPMAALKPLGAGNVLLLGWDYFSYSSDMGLILANAVRTLGGGGALTRYDVYLGTSNPPTTRVETDTYIPTFAPNGLTYATTYYWRVVARNSAGSIQGPVWSFKTLPLPLPAAPANPRPTSGATFVSVTPELNWDAGAIPATFSVRLDKQNPPKTQVASGLAQPRFSPSPLATRTSYYWQVIAHNATGDVAGPVWKFTTPAPPAVPSNPQPAPGALNVPLDVTLKWNQITTSQTATRQATGTTVQVLVFNGHSDNSAAGEYNNTLKALREHFTGFTATATATENASALAAELAGKQVFLMTEQENWNAPAMAAFGTAAGPVLKQFVQGGGLVVVCDHGPNGGASQFLANAGLMNTTFSQASGDLAAHVVASHPITAGVSASFIAKNGAVVYNSVGDARVLVANALTGKPMAAVRPLGAGNVLLLGWDYYSYDSDMGLILANAVRALGGGSGEAFTRYDVYLGTSNPPTTWVKQDTYSNQFAPTDLRYGTTYYWRVWAINSAGATQGPVWSFKTCRYTPRPIGIFSPTTGTLCRDNSLLTIDWQADLLKAGTAMQFNLCLNGKPVEVLGFGWLPYGTGLSTVYLPLLPTSNKYQIRALSLWNPTIYADSAFFTITGNPVRVMMPQAGELWKKGSQQAVYWKTNVRYAGTAVRLELWDATHKVASLKTSWDPDGEAAVMVTVPNVPSGDNYHIRAVSNFDAKYWGQSAAFSIYAPGSTVPGARNAIPGRAWESYE